MLIPRWTHEAAVAGGTRGLTEEHVGAGILAQAAERLEVSEPTVRKWLAEGLLERGSRITSRWRSPSAA